jgi:hypothetical protein
MTKHQDTIKRYRIKEDFTRDLVENETISIIQGPCYKVKILTCSHETSFPLASYQFDVNDIKKKQRCNKYENSLETDTEFLQFVDKLNAVRTGDEKYIESDKNPEETPVVVNKVTPLLAYLKSKQNAPKRVSHDSLGSVDGSRRLNTTAKGKNPKESPVKETKKFSSSKKHRKKEDITSSTASVAKAQGEASSPQVAIKKKPSDQNRRSKNSLTTLNSSLPDSVSVSKEDSGNTQREGSSKKKNGRPNENQTSKKKSSVRREQKEKRESTKNNLNVTDTVKTNTDKKPSGVSFTIQRKSANV